MSSTAPKSFAMSKEPSPKRSLVEQVKIGTHNGTFHCDESLACFLLKQLPDYKDAKIVRSRDKATLDACNIVVDVGGVYDPSRYRYDHHQRDFNETMNSFNSDYPWHTKLSSAGLVYAHFGKRIIAHILKQKTHGELVNIIYKKTYEHFIEEIDAIDNGINQTDERPRYLITTNLSSRVAHLNPKWNDYDQNPEEGFNKAMQLTGSEFLDKINYYAQSWWPARELVKEAIDRRFEVYYSGEVIEFPKGGCPWKEHLVELEADMKFSPNIKFVVFPDLNGGWRVQCVSVRLGSFENRLSLLEEWQGLRDEKLSEKSGIPGCIFVHASGFIGGNQTREGVILMAIKVLERNPPDLK